MAYPGNRDLSIEAQDRVMSAFRKVIANLQRNQREEALIGLEFVLRIDPAFSPAIELRRQLGDGAQQIDLSDLLAQLEAPSTDALNELLVEAVEDFSNRNFISAKSKVEQVLMELPGHQEGRRLLGQIQESLKVEQQVGQFLTQAREALASGDPQEAANFVLMAQALDPHHTGIAPTLQEIHTRSGIAGSPSAGSAPAPDFGSGASDGAAPWDTAAPSDDADDLFGGVDAAAEFPPPSFGFEPETPVRQPATHIETPHQPQVEPEPDDVSDLFDTGRGSSENPVIAQLFSRAAAAYESGRFLAAIDAWSRVWLEDPTNEEVGPRIEQAKKRLEQSASELQRLIFDAEDALIGGDEDKALELVNRVLAKNPSHPEALTLHRRLSGEEEAPEATGATAAPVGRAPAAAAEEMPDLDDDLFSAPFGEVDGAPFEEPAGAFAAAFEDEEPPRPSRETEARARQRMVAVSPRTLAIAVAGVVVVAILAWLGLRAIVGSREPTADNDVYVLRTEADALYAQGKVAAALQLVEQFRPRQEGDEQVVELLLAKYRAALATPTPTPVPAAAVTAQKALDRGLWFRAYDEAERGLEKHPGDGGLLAIADRAEAIDPRVSTLRTQLANRNHRAAVNTAQDMLETHPGQPDVTEALERELFNAALAELRTYNLTGARSYLDQLTALAPADEEVSRILEFIDTYKARPVDMQLKVFIQSLDERLAWSALTDSSPPPAPPDAGVSEPTPTPAAAA